MANMNDPLPLVREREKFAFILPSLLRGGGSQSETEGLKINILKTH